MELGDASPSRGARAASRWGIPLNSCQSGAGPRQSVVGKLDWPTTRLLSLKSGEEPPWL